MMGSWLVLLSLAVLAEDQADVPEVSTVSRTTMDQAVRQLGAAQFSVRRQASRFLWQQGLAAEPALRQAALDPDREIRLRAEWILNDFRYGILPGVPEEVNDLIRQFRGGDSTQRLTALQSLADRDDFDRLQRLIQLEPDGNVRRMLLVYLMHSSRAIEHFVRLERLEELITAVGADQDAAWRQTTLAQMLFSERMIRRLSERGELQVLVNVVQREPSAEVRREMLSRLFENAAAVASFIDQNHLDLVLKLIRMEPQQRVRTQWILQMAAAPQTIQNLVEREQFERFLEFARQNTEADQQAVLVQRALQHPDVIQAIVAKRGVDGLIGLSAVENDPEERGKLLATIVASTAVRQALNPDGQRDLILQLAAKQTPAATRNQYMKGILASGHGYSLFQQPDSRKALWKLIETEPPETGLAEKDWRGEAVYRMLTMASGHENFREQAELEWLLEFLDDQVTDEQRQRLLQRVLVDYRLQRLLNGIEYFDPLLSLVKRTPDDQRGVLMGRLIAMTTVQRLAEADQIGRVIALAREEAVAEARAAYLENLFRNQIAMASLIAGDQYEPLWQLLMDEQDPVRHASLRGDFYSTSAVVGRLEQQDKLDALVEFARQQTVPEARCEYLVRLFRNAQAMSLLIDRDHYETLDGMARGEPDENRRTELLSAFYLSPRVLQRLAADKQIGDVLAFAEQHLSGNALRNFLQQICQQETNIAALVDQGQLDKTLGLIRQQTQEHQQAYLMRLVLASPRVVAHYGAQDRLHELFATIAQIPLNTRHQVWDSLLQRAENLDVILKHGGLEELLRQIEQEPQAPRRGLLLGRLLTHPAVIEHWVAHEGTAGLFGLIDAQSEVQARQYLLRTLFASEPAVETLLAAGAFDELYDIALRESDQHQRTQLLAQLLTNPKMVKHLVTAGRIDRLVQIAGQQGDVEIRRQVLSQILGSPAAVDALIDGGYLDQLVKLCRSDSEASSRRQLLVTLLESRRAAERLADAEELESVIREILGETDEDSRRGFVHSLLSRHEILPVLIDHGLLGELLEAADAEQEPDERRMLLLPLLYEARSVRELVRLGRMPEMIRLMNEEIRASNANNVLYSLLANPAAVHAVIACGGFEDLLNWVGREQGRSHAAQLLARLWTSPSTVAYLVEQDHLDRFRSWFDDQQDANTRRQLIQLWLHREEAQASLAHREVAQWLVELLAGETEEGFQRSYAVSLLDNSRIRQYLVANGHAEFLREAIGWLPDESQQRQRWQDLIAAPSGLVAYHTRRGEPELAERLLKEQASDDLGRLQLAVYWWINGRAEEQIDAMQRPLQDSMDPNDARQLVYLHRVKGDLDSAYRVAQGLDDPGLQQTLLVEMRRWAEAAALQQADPCPLPIPWTHRQVLSPVHRRVEQLGLTAAYQRLAGERETLTRTITQLVETAATVPDDHSLQWLCAEALLLNGFVEQGLQHLAGYDPGRAFGFFWLRHQYHDALRLLGWQAGKTLDEDWIESLPTSSNGDEQRVVERVESALKVTRLLHRLGRRDEALAAALLVEEYGRSQADGNTSHSLRKQCLERLAQAYLALGQPQRAWTLAAETVLSPFSPELSQSPTVLTRLYRSQSNDARSWWILLGRIDPSQTADETFAQLHGVLNPSGEDEAAEFEKLVRRAVRHIDSNDEAQSDALRAAIARACLQRAQPELAGNMLKDADPSRLEILAILADIGWREQRWSEAAGYFERIWQTDHDRLADLYLAGEALRRAGLQDEADQRLSLAHRLALDSQARLQMARVLLQRGLKEQAAEQFRTILRTAPPGHLQWHEAARLMGEHLMDTQPEVAADWFDFSILDDLRPYFHLIELPDYLRTPVLIHRLRAIAAIEAGDVEAAEQLAQKALAALPSETRISEDLVHRLDEAGHSDMASRLFNQHYGIHLQWCDDWPNSAMLNNNLAWLAARCGRRLDDALRHARRAVEWEPKAAHLDTLAEVYHRQGNHEKAVEYAGRAVASEPDSDTLRNQLERFRAARP